MNSGICANAGANKNASPNGDNGSDKLLQVLLHQMPQKLQRILASSLISPAFSSGQSQGPFLPLPLPGISPDLSPESTASKWPKARHSSATPTTTSHARQELSIDSSGTFYPLSHRSPPSLLSPLSCPARSWEERHWQQLQSCALRAQSSQQNCWQMFKDFGLSTYVPYPYFETCYRASQDCLEREMHGELQIILQRQPEYPDSLFALRNSPRLLFWRGELLPQNEAATAIIGSRRADRWALRQAWQEALLLQKKLQAVDGPKHLHAEPSTQKHWIISGLAQGCDYAAHTGALDAGGPTLAVLPCGFERLYPQCHSSLAERIVAEGGALLSEYLPQAAPLKWRFIRRDRLQAALAQQLLLIQSRLDGGSMHAVQTALQLGHPVYVLDGSETCWQIQSPDSTSTTDKENLDGKIKYTGSLRLRAPAQMRQFRQDRSLMTANYTLLEKGLAQTWSRHLS